MLIHGHVLLRVFTCKWMEVQMLNMLYNIWTLSFQTDFIYLNLNGILCTFSVCILLLLLMYVNQLFKMFMLRIGCKTT